MSMGFRKRLLLVHMLAVALAHTAGAAGLVGIIFMIDFRTHHAAGFLPSSQSPEADRRGTADLT